MCWNWSFIQWWTLTFNFMRYILKWTATLSHNNCDNENRQVSVVKLVFRKWADYPYKDELLLCMHSHAAHFITNNVLSSNKGTFMQVQMFTKMPNFKVKTTVKMYQLVIWASGKTNHNIATSYHFVRSLDANIICDAKRPHEFKLSFGLRLHYLFLNANHRWR